MSHGNPEDTPPQSVSDATSKSRTLLPDRKPIPTTDDDLLPTSPCATAINSESELVLPTKAIGAGNANSEIGLSAKPASTNSLRDPLKLLSLNSLGRTQNSADHLADNDSSSRLAPLAKQQNDAIAPPVDSTDAPQFADIPVATDVDITATQQGTSSFLGDDEKHAASAQSREPVSPTSAGLHGADVRFAKPLNENDQCSETGSNLSMAESLPSADKNDPEQSGFRARGSENYEGDQRRDKLLPSSCATGGEHVHLSMDRSLKGGPPTRGLRRKISKPEGSSRVTRQRTAKLTSQPDDSSAEDSSEEPLSHPTNSESSKQVRQLQEKPASTNQVVSR